MPTQQEIKDALQLALDDNNMEVASQLRDMYLAAEASSEEVALAPEEQPLPPVEETPELKPISWLDEFEFAFDSSHSDVNNWGLALEAKLALGDWDEDANGDLTFKNGYELYGEEFMDNMDYDQRRDFLLNRRAEGVKEEHLNTILVQEKQGKSATAEIAGVAFGSLMTPSTLAPFGKGVATAAKVGGLLGLEIEAASQTAEGVLDVPDLLTSTIVGAGASAAITKVGQVAKNTIQTINVRRQAAKDPTGIQNSTKLFQNQIDKGVAEGLDPKANVSKAIQDLNMSFKDVADLAAHGKVVIPDAEDAAKIAAAKNSPIVSSNKTRQAIDQVIAPVSTVVRNIDEGVFGRLRKLEYNTASTRANYIKQSSEFMTRASRLNKQGTYKTLGTGKELKSKYTNFEVALDNGDFQKATNIAKVYFPDILEPLQKVVAKGGVLDSIHKDLKKSGVDVGYLENYFPRVVRDLGGLLNAVGKEKRGDLVNALVAEAKRKNKGNNWKALDEDVIAEVINKTLRGNVRNPSKLGNAKKRSIATLDENLKKFYYSAPESLNFYISSAVKEVEKRKFFGKSTVLDGNNNNKVNLQESVSSYLKTPVLEKLSPDQQSELQLALLARFTMGEMSGSSLTVGAKNAQTMMLLGQPDAALIQLGDMAHAVRVGGLLPTIKSLVPAVRNKTETSSAELGIIDTISADISTNGVLSSGVDSVLKWSGFKAMDRLGKDTFISAVYKNNINLAKTNPIKITEKWGTVFGDETLSLIDDLKAGKMSDNVKLLLFNELSDVQPISLSEMPQVYLNNPDGRIFYALKSFALKQIDIMRREFIQEMAKGNYNEGLKNITNYAVTVGLAGGTWSFVRDALQTKELDIDKFDDKVFESLMSVLFLNKYARDRQLSEGGVGGWAWGIATPAIVNLSDEGGAALLELAKKDEDQDPETFNKAISKLPVIGKVAYYWMLGGAERKLERERKQEERDRNKKLYGG